MHATQLAELLEPWLGHGPTYTAIAAGLRGLTLDGRLPVGQRVPSERALAAGLGLGRGTITAAYDALRADGYLTSDRGGGSRIALPATMPARPDTALAAAGLDLTVAALPAPSQLLDAVGRATVALRPLLADHGLHPFGLPSLREHVAAHLSRRGLPTRAEQVLITNGALQGWDLVLRALTRSGDRVLVEQPTYPAVLDAVGAHGRRAVALPVTSRGWDHPARAAVLAHLTPDAQNPTGLLASTGQRRRVLTDLAGVQVVADETFADLVLDGPAGQPLARLRADVLTVGSMSKAFWAGLRIGWIRADPTLVRRLAQLRGAQDLASPVLEQLVAAELLQRAEEILPERREQLRRGRDALLHELTTRLPTWRCTPPRAGMVLWVELPETGASRLAAHALDLGLRLTPGPRFTIDGTADRWLRLPFTTPPERAVHTVQLLRQAHSRLSSTPLQDPARWTA